MGKTNKKHFRIFKRECERLQRKWGLNDWELRCWHWPTEDNVSAYCEADLNGRFLSVALSNSEWFHEPLTSGYIKDLARHEMIHALVQPLGQLSEERFTSLDAIKQAKHEVLERLMRLLPR